MENKNNQQTLDKLVFNEIENEDIVEIEEKLFEELTYFMYGKNENGTTEQSIIKNTSFDKNSPNFRKINGNALRIYIQSVNDDSIKERLATYLIKK